MVTKYTLVTVFKPIIRVLNVLPQQCLHYYEPGKSVTTRIELKALHSLPNTCTVPGINQTNTWNVHPIGRLDGEPT